MKTILIVDDEPAARYGLRRALESKYRIAEADSAETARGALATEQPDLVLLDVVMPGQSGIAFLQWMREQGSDVPVLMVSGLLLRNLQALFKTDLGFDQHRIIAVNIDLSRGNYQDRDPLLAFYHPLLDRVSHLPGVTASGFSKLLR